MGSIIGALLGAVCIILVGKGLKGRDFLGLAAAFFFLALVAGVFLAPAAWIAEGQIAARGDGAAVQFLPFATGVVTFCVAFIPGVIFVLLASPAKRGD